MISLGLSSRFVGSTLAVTSFLAAAPASASDWMVIGQEPDPAPHRSVYVLQFGESWISHRLDEGSDMNALEQTARSSKTPSAAIHAQAISSVNVLQVFENAGGTNFIHYVVEFKCRDGLVRIPQATAFDRAGKQEKSSALQWMKVPDNWIGQAEMIACNWKKWEAAERSWRQPNAPKSKRKTKEAPASFASLRMEYLGDYAAWTSVVDAVWHTKWVGAKQPAYINTGTPEDLARLKREGLAILDKAKAIGTEQQKWSKISIALSDKANRMGGKLAQEMSNVGGQTEDQVIARWGVPQSESDRNGVRQLNYNWQSTETHNVPVTVDIMGTAANGSFGKIGETYQIRTESRTAQCHRTLFLQKGGALETAYRVYDFNVGCN